MLRAHAVSDAGRVRKGNEDAYIVADDLSLYAVADGMGGHEAGEVASRLAIEALSAFIRRSATDTDFSWPYGIERTLTFAGNRLRTAIHLANRRVFRAAESNDDYNGMGTTIVALLAAGAHFAIGNVGDSRLYLLRDGRIEQITQDDSWAATVLAHDPRSTRLDVTHHPMRNVLTNALGAREQVDVHLTEIDAEPGDILLLCSDGLHGALDAPAIHAIVTGQPDVALAARELVGAALDQGSRDNVTALVVRYEGPR